MLDRIKDFIKFLGYKIKDVDNSLIDYILGNETDRLKNDINQTEIPEKLEFLLIERVVSAFFNMKISTNSLGDDFSFEESVKLIKMGDTSYDFGDVSSQKDMFVNYINSLGKGSDYICYRKFKW
ncbi:hypothetical protein HMPREF9629_00622 [Peptoanaerobacter stomatis]|jgi:hypothetical protein|uniref:Phage gp6-like head-tail connector protein n=1 Tax=Peptoanaerobacter stomatis TaxID=796937 RepID=G9X2L5_9FIRM|nr:hypothetical protein [Peptoanaerobacter stomatis]EHL11085.1 hypothetical protein HMPREF9629_00622 [Peptoanaerobacter stomatis]